MLPNWITISRFPLLLTTVLILYYGPPVVRLAGVVILFVGLMLDSVDGIVARKTAQTSLFGSVLDIAADRTYELVLWVCFADLGMIPLAIPLIIIARTTLTDAFRSIALATPEPSAARTYELFAVAVERGADLAEGLLALGDQLREARREEIRKQAVRRRAAMLLPTIGILAPIMLLFIAAPLPSIVLGHH